MHKRTEISCETLVFYTLKCHCVPQELLFIVRSTFNQKALLMS